MAAVVPGRTRVKTAESWFQRMKPSWIEMIKAFGPIIGALISLLGFTFLIRQVRLNRLSLENQTRSSIYQLSYNVYRLFIEHPDLRPYFYDGKALPEAEPERSKVLAAAELLTDFFESIVHSAHIIDPDLRDTWFKYMEDTYQYNPVFQEYIETREKHYTKALHKAIGSKKKQYSSRQRGINRLYSSRTTTR